MKLSPSSIAAIPARWTKTGVPEDWYWIRFSMTCPRAGGASIQPRRQPVMAQFLEKVWTKRILSSGSITSRKEDVLPSPRVDGHGNADGARARNGDRTHEIGPSGGGDEHLVPRTRDHAKDDLHGGHAARRDEEALMVESLAVDPLMIAGDGLAQFRD